MIPLLEEFLFWYAMVMNSSQKAVWLLENSKTMVIATADENGKPWISPVFFSYDDSHSLYWVSDKGARHSENVRNRPEIGVVIYGKVPPEEYPDAVYFDAVALELESEEDIRHGITALAKREQAEKFVIKSIADVTGPSCWRIYRATAKEITKREDATDPTTGQAITIRIPVRL